MRNLQRILSWRRCHDGFAGISENLGSGLYFDVYKHSFESRVSGFELKKKTYKRGSGNQVIRKWILGHQFIS